MEAKATHKYIKVSPRKMRLVIDLIRGKSAEEALSILHFNPKHASTYAEKVLKSAIANLLNNEEGSNFDISDIYVKEVYANPGPMLKRIQPAPMGRAYRIRRRTNHLTIVVATKS
jgi:large subunit ribosomal protein L22